MFFLMRTFPLCPYFDLVVSLPLPGCHVEVVSSTTDAAVLVFSSPQLPRRIPAFLWFKAERLWCLSVFLSVRPQTSLVSSPAIWADTPPGKTSRRFCRSWMEKSQPPWRSASARSASGAFLRFHLHKLLQHSDNPSFNLILAWLESQYGIFFFFFFF